MRLLDTDASDEPPYSLLRQEDVVAFLCRRGLMKPEHIVTGACDVIDSSRRNRNFKVISERGPGYLIKQGLGDERRRTVAHEAAMYQFLGSLPQSRAIAGLLPKLRLYDCDRSLLVLELVRNGRTVGELNRARGQFPRYIARALGEAVGLFHAFGASKAVQSAYTRQFAVGVPFGLSLQRPDLQIFRHASQAAIDLVRIVQQADGLPDFLDQLRINWTYDGLIHGDLRWDNCTVSTGTTVRRKPQITFVDWELAGCGDPCWDVGTVFGEYLSCWLLSAPLSESTPPERYLTLARYSLESMQPSMRAFWSAYVSILALSSERAVELLIRVVRYTAARLVQTAFERVQMAAQVTGQTIFLIQVSKNMFDRPQQAAITLLGIP